MTGAPIGSNVGLYIDAARILGEGDMVVTSTGRTYRVTSNRIQERGKHAGRQHLRVNVVDPAEAEDVDEDTYVLRIFWYSRG